MQADALTGPDGCRGWWPETRIVLSQHEPSAVDVKGRTRAIAALIACQERDERGDLFGFAETFERDLIADRLHTLGRQVAHEIGIKNTGCNAVHQNSIGRDFPRHGLAKHHDRALRATVDT